MLENSSSADFRMRIFNADGSEAEMCGNGIRCLYKFLQELDIKSETLTIETMVSRVEISKYGNLVRASLPPPVDIQWNIKVFIEKHEWPLHFLDTGVPHAIHFVEDLEEEQWMKTAPLIRYHKCFAPKGTNVNFAKITLEGKVQLRTYERGVEGETLACGTGAVATALAAAKVYNLPSPVLVLPRLNEPIEVSFEWENGSPINVQMAGPARLVFRGECRLPHSCII